MVDAGAQPTRAERRIAAKRARRRYQSRAMRLERERRAVHAANRGAGAVDANSKQQTVQRAIERARQRLAQRNASKPVTP
jgi:hypothetical protein